MWMDREFITSVEELNVPTMGAEVMGPLLYSLIRFVRARSVLEAGAGYTTLFIAKALRDNEECFTRERADLRIKSDAYLRDIDAMASSAKTPMGGPEQRGLGAIYAPKTSELADRRTEWMFANPAALMNPAYYVEERRSKLYCVDDHVSSESSSARRVMSKLRELELATFVSHHVGNFWSFNFTDIAAGHTPFDLIWIDIPVSVKNVVSLLSGGYWKLLNPNGGLLIMHDMLSNEGGQVLVQEWFKADQQKRFGEFEFVAMLEPHRVIQNSFVMLRKVTKFAPQKMEALFTAPGEALFEEKARELVAAKPYC